MMKVTLMIKQKDGQKKYSMGRIFNSI